MPITDDQTIAVPPPQERMSASSAPTSTPAPTLAPSPVDTPPPPPGFLDSDGLLIHYETFGKGYPIVLVYGFVGSIQGDWVDTSLANVP